MYKRITALGIASAALIAALPATAVAAEPPPYKQLRDAIAATNTAYSTGVYTKTTSKIDGPERRETSTYYEGAVGTNLFGANPSITHFWKGSSPTRISDAWQVRTPGTMTRYESLGNLRSAWSRRTANIVLADVRVRGGNSNSLAAMGSISQNDFNVSTTVASPARVVARYLDANPDVVVTQKTTRRTVTYTFVANNGTTVTTTTTPSGVITKLQQTGPYYNSELTTTILGGGETLKLPATLTSAVDSPLPARAVDYEVRASSLRNSLQIDVNFLNQDAERTGVRVTKEALRELAKAFAGRYIGPTMTLAEVRRGYSLTMPLPAEEELFGPLCVAVVESAGKAKLGAC